MAVIAALAMLAGEVWGGGVAAGAATAAAAASLPPPPAVPSEPVELPMTTEVEAAPPLAAMLLVSAGAIGVFLLLRLWRLPQRGELALGGGPAVLFGLLGAALLLQPIGGAVGVLLAGGSPGDSTAPGLAPGLDPGLAPGLAEAAATDNYARTLAFAMAGALLAQVPIAVLVLRASRRAAERSAWPEATLLGIATAIVTFPMVAVAAIAASILRERLTGVPTDAIAHDTLRLIVEAPSVWTTLLAALAIVGAPITEEVLYRGLGHGCLATIGAGAWTRITVVAALFALAHWASVAPPALAALFVLGVSFGWVRERTGTLIAPIVAHALFNAANVLLAT